MAKLKGLRSSKRLLPKLLLIELLAALNRLLRGLSTLKIIDIHPFLHGTFVRLKKTTRARCARTRADR